MKRVMHTKFGGKRKKNNIRGITFLALNGQYFQNFERVVS